MIVYVLKYFFFYLKAASQSTLHSPFVYQLYNLVIQSKQEYYAFSEIENLRQKLISDPTELEITDFGAGSKHKNYQLNSTDSTRKSVSQLARYSASKIKKAKLLFRLVEHFKPKTILELGTSLGISTLYMALASDTSTRIITFEGCKQIAKKAKENFEEFEQKY